MSTDAFFEVLRFEAVPAPGGVAVLELEGVFAHAPPRRTRLLVEREGRSAEVPAVAVLAEPWTATFAIALDDLADPETAYALVPDRGAVIGLPAPSHAGEQDRYVRMARSANELRHRMTEHAAAAAAAEARTSELEAERDGLAGELATVRGELEATTSRADDAERTAEAARAQRDSATASGDEARQSLEGSREETRAAEQRADAAERDAAAQRARADAADREAADQRECASDEKDRADDLDERLVAAEDEVRAARRELRETRARLESVLRERRTRAQARRAVTAEDDGTDEHDLAPVDTGEHDGVADVTAGHEDDAGGTDEHDAAAETQPTEPLGVRGDADEDAGRDGGDAEEDGEGEEAADEEPGDGAEASALATRPTRTVRIWADPSTGEDDAVPTNGRHPVTGEVLDPAAVGARYIEPSTTRSTQLTPERLVVGGILLFLVAVLLLILLGVV